MKYKNVLMIQYRMHKRTSTNKYNIFGGKNTPSAGKNFKININANSKQYKWNVATLALGLRPN